MTLILVVPKMGTTEYLFNGANSVVNKLLATDFFHFSNLKLICYIINNDICEDIVLPRLNI